MCVDAEVNDPNPVGREPPVFTIAHRAGTAATGRRHRSPPGERVAAHRWGTEQWVSASPFTAGPYRGAGDPAVRLQWGKSCWETEQWVSASPFTAGPYRGAGDPVVVLQWNDNTAVAPGPR